MNNHCTSEQNFNRHSRGQKLTEWKDTFIHYETSKFHGINLFIQHNYKFTIYLLNFCTLHIMFKVLLFVCSECTTLLVGIVIICKGSFNRLNNRWHPCFSRAYMSSTGTKGNEPNWGNYVFQYKGWNGHSQVCILCFNSVQDW